MPSTNKSLSDREEADVLQAVILADSFDKRFKPLATDRPKVPPSRKIAVSYLNTMLSVYSLFAMPLY